MILPGTIINVKEANRTGLVNEVIPLTRLIPGAEAMLNQINSNAPLGMKFSIDAVGKGLDVSPPEGLLIEASLFGICAGSEEKKEGQPPPWQNVRRGLRDAKEIEILMSVMENDNIFSGLRVVDLASFIAGPGAATILSDFGADVIKVEPPNGELWRVGQKIPPHPHSEEPYPFQLANRNKRGVALNLKDASAYLVLERLAKWADVFIVNTPHPARKKLKLQYDDVVQWNPRLIYADLTGFGEKGPDANLPGFDLTAYWARSGLLSMTRAAGEPPTWPVAGSGDNATAICIYAAIATALYRRERSGKGSYVTTSLLAAGVWSASVFVQAALCGASFYGLHDRAHPANAALNTYRSSDDVWFVLVATPDKIPAVLTAMDREDILADPRFSDPAKLAQNRPQLTAMLDETFGSQPMAHWYEVFNGVHVPFGAVREPQEVVNDPQLRANDIIVPLEGAGEKLTSTISSPIQVHGVSKVPARRAPGIGEHNDEVLKELGFTSSEIEGLRAGGTIPLLAHASNAAD